MNNFSHLAKYRLSKTFLLAVVIAFLTTQWSSTHIHLGEHHDHDDSHHQHDNLAHAHQTISHNDSAIESAHLSGDDSVITVELEHKCNTQIVKKIDDNIIGLTSADYYLSYSSQQTSTDFARLRIAKHRYLDYSTIHLRAPPDFS